MQALQKKQFNDLIARGKNDVATSLLSFSSSFIFVSVISAVWIIPSVKNWSTFQQQSKHRIINNQILDGEYLCFCIIIVLRVSKIVAFIVKNIDTIIFACLVDWLDPSHT